MCVGCVFECFRDATAKNRLFEFASRPGHFMRKLEDLASIQLKGLILAQNERWRRGLGMQVVRETSFGRRKAAKGRVTRGYLPSGPG